MKNKALVITALLLLIALVNFFIIINSGRVKTVDFISIFAIGALSGVLITLLITLFRKK